MTDELKKLLEAAHTEEMQDHKKYLNMAEQAEAQECFKACRVLRDMAHEEYTHANAIANLLEIDE